MSSTSRASKQRAANSETTDGMRTARLPGSSLGGEERGSEADAYDHQGVQETVEPFVEVPKLPFDFSHFLLGGDVLKAFVDAREAFVDVLKAFVDVLKAFVDVLKAFVDAREAFVHPAAQFVEPAVVPAVHLSLHLQRLHDDTSVDRKFLRVARRK